MIILQKWLHTSRTLFLLLIYYEYFNVYILYTNLVSFYPLHASTLTNYIYIYIYVLRRILFRIRKILNRGISMYYIQQFANISYFKQFIA